MVSAGARAIATNPFVELDLGVLFRRHDLGDVTVLTSNWPIAAIAVPLADTIDDLPGAVGAAREVGRGAEVPAIAWWIAPRHDHLAPMLEALGVPNGETPGFEAVETAMVLDREPAGERVAGVEVRVAETLEDFVAAALVQEQAFGLPAVSDEENRRLYADYASPGNTARQYLASVDGRPVGSAFTVAGTEAVNLFAGGVLEEARGRGVYRALVQARWDDAVERGTPVLTVQAGRQSQPILERLGFQPIAQARMFVDTLA
jgi:GNAT superfamily N-acetyltransferase